MSSLSMRSGINLSLKTRSAASAKIVKDKMDDSMSMFFFMFFFKYGRLLPL